MSVSDKQQKLISILVPAFNEEDVLPDFYEKLVAVLDTVPFRFEILFVNDGSSDRTLPTLMRLRDADKRIGILDLSRNFGKEIAMAAGLDHINGDAAIIMDADLQHPPELIPQFIAHWAEGFDVVYAERQSREDETWLKKTMANLFYFVIGRISKVAIPEHAGDFRLLGNRAINAVRRLREHHRFMKGLYAWIGYRQKAVPYSPDPRHAGATKWSFWRLWNFAIEGLTSFSTVPLKVATYLGFVVAFVALCYGLYIIGDTIFAGNPVPGYPSLMAVVLFLGGIQLMFVGIVGEYVGRMFDETKNRPLYFVDDHLPASHTAISEKAF